MTTITGQEDPFDEVERGIDWLERLENIRARQDREAAIRESVEYVKKLREALVVLSGETELEQIAEAHGNEIADLVRGVRDGGEDDPWVRYLQPSLLEQ